MHEEDIWQECGANGERLMNGGLGSDEKSKDFYYGVAIMLYRYKDNQVEYLFQHRSKLIIGNPDKWDVSAGGHVNYEEPCLDAMVREAKEEIGAEIDPSRLEYASEYRAGNDRYVRLYFYDWQDQSSDFHFDDQEVSEVKWVAFDQLVEFWPNLKGVLQNDAIYQTMLLKWTKTIQEKYGNHQSRN